MPPFLPTRKRESSKLMMCKFATLFCDSFTFSMMEMCSELVPLEQYRLFFWKSSSHDCCMCVDWASFLPGKNRSESIRNSHCTFFSVLWQTVTVLNSWENGEELQLASCVSLEERNGDYWTNRSICAQLTSTLRISSSMDSSDISTLQDKAHFMKQKSWKSWVYRFEDLIDVYMNSTCQGTHFFLLFRPAISRRNPQ